jgi:hypothetical protein
MNHFQPDLFLQKNTPTNTTEVTQIFGWIGQFQDILVRNSQNGISTVIVKMKRWYLKPSVQFRHELFTQINKHKKYTNEWCANWRVSVYLDKSRPQKSTSRNVIGRDTVPLPANHNSQYCDEYGRDVELRVRMMTKLKPNYVYSADSDEDNEVTTNINEINHYHGLPRFTKIVLVNGKFQRRFYD